MLRAPALLVASLLVVFGCSTTDKKDILLLEAAEFHHEASHIQEDLEPQINQIDSLKNLLAKRSDPAAAATVATLDSLKKAFEEWEENLVEVPGMPDDHHEHGNHEHHHHTDATLKDLPADKMRDLQKETRDNILQIQQRTETAIKQATTLVQ